MSRYEVKCEWIPDRTEVSGTAVVMISAPQQAPKGFTLNLQNIRQFYDLVSLIRLIESSMTHQANERIRHQLEQMISYFE